MRQGRSVSTRLNAGPDSSRSAMDKSRSSTYPKSDSCRSEQCVTRSVLRAYGAALQVLAVAAALVVAPGCHGFDTEREPQKTGTVGEEIYGVVCDRVGANALREDLTGGSFRGV